MDHLRSTRLQVAGFVAAAAAMAGGAALAYIAWRQGSHSMGLGAVVLLLVGPALTVAPLVSRREITGIEADKPARLSEDLRRSDLALRFIRLARANVLVAASYAFVLWTCQLGGLIDAPAFTWSYTGICALAALAYLPWLARQEIRAQSERQVRRQRLAELKIARDW